MKKLLATLVASALSVCAMAVETKYFVKNGATDLSSPESYYLNWSTSTTATGLPGADDIVFLQRGMAQKVVAGDAGYTTLNKAKAIWLPENSTLEIEVPAGEAATFSPKIKAYKWGENTALLDQCVIGCNLVKTGDGSLTLGATEEWLGGGIAAAGYIVCSAGMEVKAGALKLPPTTANNLYYGPTKVAAGATLELPGNSKSMAVSYFLTLSVAEGGHIDNNDAGQSHPFGTWTLPGYEGEESVLAGLIGGTGKGAYIFTAGKIRIVTPQTVGYSAFVANGNGELQSTDLGASKWTNNAWNDSTLSRNYITDLGGGKSGLASGYVYLGEGESTYRTFRFSASAKKADGSSADPVYFDAGKVGGITFIADSANKTFGSYYYWNSDEALVRIVLKGDNAKECKVQQAWNTNNGGKYIPAYLNKEGTGCWYLMNPSYGNRDHVGVTQVSDGTLKFESIAEAGEYCALGLSNDLRADDSRAMTSDSYKVPYALVLGSNDGHGDATLEYAGKNTGICSTRPLALASKGGTLKAANGALDFSGVSARDASEPTLKLVGAGEIGEISDGAGKVSVESDGDWVLKGNQTFSGDVKVNSGKLALKVPRTVEKQTYKWYRLSFAQLGPNGNSHNGPSIRQIGLYSADGVRQNVGLNVVNGISTSGSIIQAAEIGKGEAGYDASMAGHRITLDSGFCDITGAFREDGYNGNDYGRCYFRHITSDYKAIIPNPNDPSTWVKIVMHLADSAKPVTHFDIQCYDYASSNISRIPSRIMLEASLDGQNWDVVYNNATTGDEFDVSKISGYNHWLSDDVSASNASHARPAGKGFATSASVAYPVNAFSWYRFSIASLGKSKDTEGNDTIKIRQFCLYDDGGNLLTKNLAFPAAAYERGSASTTVKAYSPKAGEVAYDKSMVGQVIADVNNGQKTSADGLATLFTCTSGGNDLYFVKLPKAPVAGDPTTWHRFVMHLADGSKPAKYFDIQGWNISASQTPVKYVLEGSVDGENWVEVFKDLTGERSLSEYTSYSPSLATEAGWKTALPRTISELVCFTASALGTKDTGDEPADQLANIASVEVKGGAEFAATRPFAFAKPLVIDAVAGAGKLTGFDIAAGGVITVKNFSKATKTVKLPILENCTGSFANWSVVLQGQGAEKFEANFDGSQISILRKAGTMIIVQ